MSASTMSDTLVSRLTRGRAQLLASKGNLPAVDLAAIERDVAEYRVSLQATVNRCLRILVGVGATAGFLCFGLAIGTAIRDASWAKGAAAVALVGVWLGGMWWLDREGTAAHAYASLKDMLRPLNKYQRNAAYECCQQSAIAKSIRAAVDAEGGVLRQFHLTALEKAAGTYEDFESEGNFFERMSAVVGMLLIVSLMVTTGYYGASAQHSKAEKQRIADAASMNRAN